MLPKGDCLALRGQAIEDQVSSTCFLSKGLYLSGVNCPKLYLQLRTQEQAPAG